jgi:ribosome production factor 1
MSPDLSRVRNKLKRQDLFVKQKRDRENTRRDERMRRKREEIKNPQLKEERIKKNIPATIERKRTWDQMSGSGKGKGAGEGKLFGLSVDVNTIGKLAVTEESSSADEDEDDDDHDSMLDSESDDDEIVENGTEKESDLRKIRRAKQAKENEISSNGSTEEGLENKIPNAAMIELQAKFPTLFKDEPPTTPKVLVTTSINSTLHAQAEDLTSLFPNSVYIRRSAHRYGHKFSVREISGYAYNRKFTTLIVLREDSKKPTGLTMVHLPAGPTFHFTISNWMTGKKLPGHGRPTNHFPELILNNFRTPLGILTAHSFETLFPPQPEIMGRQVVTLHNQRDYIFVRRHRYVFREKRQTEKSVIGPDGKPVKGVEDIRAGLQELGPRFTLKLRRVDAAIGRGTKPEDVEWEWKSKMEKQRTRFQL